MEFSIIWKSKLSLLMLKMFLALITAAFISVSAFSQGKNLSGKWSNNTAFLIPAGKWESGIFQSFRYGINKSIELKSNAIIIPVLPNAGVKIALGKAKEFLFASEHLLSFPSMFLNIVSFKGVGGLISPQYSFPFIMSFSNSVIVSRYVTPGSVISANIGLALPLRSNKPDYQSTIDIPFIYQRMAHCYEGISVRTGISIKGTITGKLFFEEGVRMFLITRGNDNLFFENSGSVLWAAGKSLRINAGYMLSWGKYPFGNHLQMWPAIDFIFGKK
jgi:hypothetical protein